MSIFVEIDKSYNMFVARNWKGKTILSAPTEKDAIQKAKNHTLNTKERLLIFKLLGYSKPDTEQEV